jgi:hypothetical protein
MCLAQVGQCFDAADAGQTEVEQHEIEVDLFVGQTQGLLAIRGLDHGDVLRQPV